MSYCQGSLLLVIPLYALELGASPAITAFIFSLRGLGNMVADLPAGYITARFGNKTAMLLGLTMMSTAGLTGMHISTSLHLGLLSFIAGCAMALWLLARLTLVGDSVPTDHRGKALSTMGGSPVSAPTIHPLDIDRPWIRSTASTSHSGISTFLRSFPYLAPSIECIPRDSPLHDMFLWIPIY